MKSANSYVALAASDAIIIGPIQGPTPEVLAVQMLRQPRHAKASNLKNGKSLSPSLDQRNIRDSGVQGMARQPIFEPHVHIKSVCRSGQSVNKSHNDYKVYHMDVGDDLVDTNTHDLSRKPRHALLINRHNVEFKVDTGSPIALIGETLWKNIGSHRRARSRIKVYAYGQQQHSVTGQCTVEVKRGSTVLSLSSLL